MFLPVVVVSILNAAGAQGQTPPLESMVKATFLYKFGPFVDWPAAAFDSATSPFALCIVGDDPFGPVIEQAAAGQHVGQHPVTIQRMAKVERAPPCHVLFVAGSKAQPVAQALAAVQGAPVLTVTDQGHGAASRGMINFVLHNNRVRFQIDARAASQGGLSISSKLLSLAVGARAAEAAP